MKERKEMTERECFGHLLHALGNARDAARGLALLRRDQHVPWLALVHIFDRAKDQVERLMHSTKGQVVAKSPGLIIPGRQH